MMKGKFKKTQFPKLFIQLYFHVTDMRMNALALQQYCQILSLSLGTLNLSLLFLHLFLLLPQIYRHLNLLSMLASYYPCRNP